MSAQAKAAHRKTQARLDDALKLLQRWLNAKPRHSQHCGKTFWGAHYGVCSCGLDSIAEDTDAALFEIKR